jgi:DNA-binding XRE family transcriptional regulator
MKANLLKAEIARAGMTQTKLAEEIGMSPQTLSKKIITGKIGLDEAEKIIRVLRIKDPVAIFLRSD